MDNGMDNDTGTGAGAPDASVVIVGAGPVGLMLACELGLAGVDTVVLDRAPDRETGENLRSTMLHARAADLLDRRGLLDRLRRIEEPAKWPMIHFANFWLDLTELLDHEYSLIVPQLHTVRVLEERARELGADIRRGHEVTGLDQDAAGVTVRVRTPSGDRSVSGRYLAGCDGEDSTVRELAGFEAPPSGAPWYGILADFERLDAQWGSTMYPGGLLGITPHPYKKDWVRMMTVEFGVTGPGRNEPVTAAELGESLRRVSGEEWTLEPPAWMYRYSGRTRLASAYRRDRVFLAGDAAHVHYFGAGHGTSTGLHDAVNLGWKLAAEILGWAPPGLLDTYHAERHTVGRRVRMSQQAQLALQYPLDRVEPLRELFGELVGLQDVNRLLVGLVTDVRYPVDGAHPLVGRPVPDAALFTARGETRTAELLRAGRGVLIDLSDGAATGLGPAAEWAGRVEAVAAKPVTEIDAAAVLVRPDGHVAWADPEGTDEDGLRAALGTWFGAPQAAL
ncbi:FAD-dependent monooxygenase [Actinomadura opuntiae]|uniref:FAD-dependent monooxygenase n=1 Tax=Actinomadura sp. OS1-43 TaxID=604315 RepID=UPI00255B2B53|nr:FAD-dependent monooxygenase [Actinomadura sp. OS1-43]MDL4815433.1 FAD-dependent monooxygenase [Actinomadura sp. OS1-43]